MSQQKTKNKNRSLKKKYKTRPKKKKGNKSKSYQQLLNDLDNTETSEQDKEVIEGQIKEKETKIKKVKKKSHLKLIRNSIIMLVIAAVIVTMMFPNLIYYLF